MREDIEKKKREAAKKKGDIQFEIITPYTT